MTRLILAAIAGSLLVPSVVSAQVYVNGYTRSDGTYVAGHYRSSPNSTKLDNYSTKGNINPYTGEVGTVNPYPNTYSAPSWTPPKSSYDDDDGYYDYDPD